MPINHKEENQRKWYKKHKQKQNGICYATLHNRIHKQKPKPELCEECGIRQPKDLANISGEYKIDINDFQWLCQSCHSKKDGIIQNLPSTKTHGLSQTREYKINNCRRWRENNKAYKHKQDKEYRERNKEKISKQRKESYRKRQEELRVKL